ncbi:DUF4012 domain-containing protein [Microbacterium terricola]|uniref:DUF4012 domain-containing protein n=1 Tax=Microbacterium terricola TaxID=344163 RepID=A0ABM8DVQ8_9MICO|nr:DUF4012 domain-containing protein [Microbacterium terricola]UYK39509.1 DUF4012 domain-containing protein [Microbacterium terricola]BDV29758.1 hypothetical protein Microterr_04180 [Microbacterium terricola]
MSEPVLPKPVRIAGIVFASLLGAAIIGSIAALAWIGTRGAAAYGHLRAAETTVHAVIDDLSDPTSAAGLIDDLAADTGAAHDLTSDPIWAAAERVPWLGPQLEAVSTIAAAADDIATTALPPLADVASSFSLDDFRPAGGAIDTALFESIAEPARIGADSVAAAAASVGHLDGNLLLGPVRDAVDEVSGLLDSSATATDALARATELLPPMLGADGPRDYLIIFQNNAEWRSLGGLVGAMALIHTSDGTMEMTAQASASGDFPKYSEAVIPLSDEVTKIYGTRPAQWMHNVTQLPDFSLSGQIAREMWLREMGTEVDGVIAMDPVALSYLLEATGPITLTSGDVLTADNAVQLLLNDVYKRYPEPADQDEFFALAAASVFDALSTGAADPATLVQALGRAGDERRLLIWSAIADDQDVLTGTTLAGGLPETTRQTARMGVYLNDGTGSKMDYYVTADTTLGWESCTLDADGRATGQTTLTLTLTNTAPEDAATSLPDYITGAGAYVQPEGTARTVAYIYLPEGYDLTTATVTGSNGFGGGFHDGRQVLTFSSDLPPGESVTAVIGVQAPEPAAAAVIAEITPTIDAEVPSTVKSSCDPG